MEDFKARRSSISFKGCRPWGANRYYNIVWSRMPIRPSSVHAVA